MWFLSARIAAMAIVTPSLLITDDDYAFRETLQAAFEPRGYRTLLAGDGEEALRIVRTEVVHLALLDMHMPRLTGLETLRLVKQFKAMLPCIILSADLDETIAQQARREHAYSVLRKPVTLIQIMRVVRQALEATYHWQAYRMGS
jgi:CheY-like chemotaxis protein